MGEHAEMSYDGETMPDGRIRVSCWTNDNYDRGYPSGNAGWFVTCRDRADFDKHCGKSRTGISGIRVSVTLDGKDIR